MKNKEILENVWKILLGDGSQKREVSGQNFPGQNFGRHLEFFKNFILHKIAANFTEISRKHVFPASNRNIIENRV